MEYTNLAFYIVEVLDVVLNIQVKWKVQDAYQLFIRNIKVVLMLNVANTRTRLYTL